jgi:hypothetical protein
MQEEILLKKSRTGTTVVFFDTKIPLGEKDSVPSIVLLNQQGVPQYVNQFDGNEVWLRNSQNNLVRPTEFDQYYTGHSYANAYNFVFNEEDKNAFKLTFLEEMSIRFGGDSKSFVFFHDAEIDDLFVTTKLVRSRDFLNTLDVYNNLTNSLPDQEADTGTLMGTLNALQPIRDEIGNKIRIPLANVPVGVFVPSTQFPRLGALDSQGDRITLNLKEGSSPDEYFDPQSFNQDNSEYLRSGSEFDTIPSHYKHFTYTNDNGEFILNNVPTGSQVMLFEVDLFKQGLTKDEIALNNFPFPVNDEPNLDTIPSLFYRQIPLDIIPNWGSFQTGYTEVNIDVNLDLRKWVTFFTTPISFEGKAIEELQAKGYNSPLTFSVRDMSQEGYPIKNKEIVEIHNMYDRDEDSRIFWYNEFAQRKKNAEFRTKGYHAFKIPANMYDPDGFRTDANGNPTGKRGVWLAGYQISQQYISKDAVFRHTGLEKTHLDEVEYATRDHFNLNRNNTSYSTPNAGSVGVEGFFPYEKPWSPLYPEKYSIPKVPVVMNPDFNLLSEEGKKYIERPKYIDGDLVGRQFADFSDENSDSGLGGTGGYGVSYDGGVGASLNWFKNNFSKTVTQNYLYKYEQGVNQNEMYANGYKPNVLFPIDNGVSSVLNGEKYQRVECGYGYWLRPEGMPRVFSYPWWGGSEAMLENDTDRPNLTVSESEATTSYYTSVAPYSNSISFENFEDGRRIALEMGNSPNIREGSLDIYRILDPSPYNLVSPDPVPISQFVKLKFGKFYAQRGKSGNRLRPQTKNDGGAGGRKFWSNDSEGNMLTMQAMTLEITNKGVVDVDIMGMITLTPNQSYPIPFGLFGSFNHLELILPTNAVFDFDDFKYTKARYGLVWKNITLYNGGNNLKAEGPEGFSVPIVSLNHTGGDENAIPTYHMRTRLLNCRTNYSDGSWTSSEGCKDHWVSGNKGQHTIEVNGMAIANPAQNKGGWYDSRFMSDYVGYTCNGGVSNLIPYHLA